MAGTLTPTEMILSTLLLASTLSTSVLPAQPGPWFGEDKFQHFFTSFVVTSLAASAARVAGADSSTSQIVGASTGGVAGLYKEWSDHQAGGPFSGKDLAWDLAGIATAAALLQGSR